MSRRQRHPVAWRRLPWAFGVIPLALVVSLVPPILITAPPSDGATTKTTITQVIDVTVTRESTTTTTTSTTTSTTTTTIATQPGSAQPPTAAQASQSLAPAHAAPPATAAPTPPALSHTGAPIVFELVLAALLVAVGGLILGRRRLFRRRRA